MQHPLSRSEHVAGSAVAFGKLHGVLPSKPLNLPGKNALNIGLAAGNIAAGAAFLSTGDPTTGLAMLTATSALGGVMGAHMTASIGGLPLPDIQAWHLQHALQPQLACLNMINHML